IACYEEAIAASDVVQDLQQLSLVYAGLSLAYQETGHVSEGVRYAQKASPIHETLHDRLSQARSMNNIGYMLVRLGRFDAARSHLIRALAIFEELRVETRKGDILHSLADLELAEGNLREASRLAMQALDLGEKLDEGPTVASARTLLGKVAEREGRRDGADREFTAALVAAEPIGGAGLVAGARAYAGVPGGGGWRCTRHTRCCWKRAAPWPRPACSCASPSPLSGRPLRPCSSPGSLS